MLVKPAMLALNKYGRLRYLARMRIVSPMVALAACGRLHFDPLSDAASLDAAPRRDAESVCQAEESVGPDTESFDGFVDGPLQAVQNGATVRFTGGEMNVTVISAPGSNYAGIVSSNLENFTKRRISIEVPQAIAQTNSAVAECDFGFQSGADYISILAINSQLKVTQRLGGIFSVLNAISFDAVAQRFWQFRATPSFVIWSYSADRLTWTELARSDLSDPMVRALVEASVLNIGGGTARFGAGPFDDLRFDNLVDCIEP